ncbi:hypothetical protein D3C72_517930 [compost metagenome]
MKKAYWETALGIAIAVAIFASGLSLGFIVNRFPSAPGDAATWAGALLAGLAFAGTIWIAVSQAHRDRQEKRTLAELAAASFSPRIIQVMASVTEADAHIKSWGGFFEDFQGCADHLRKHELWSPADLIPLAPLPNDAAIKLAAAVSNIKACISMLEGAHKDVVEQDMPEFCAYMQDSLGEISLQLVSGFTECHRASREKTAID